MSTFWKKTSFWDMVIKTLALFGPGGGVAIGTYVQDRFWVGMGVACLAVSAVLSIWFVDKDNNGTVDLFQRKRPKGN